MGTHGTDASGSIAPIINTAYRELREAGHYQGAMFHYGGDWYWGIDRLPLLEERLQRDLGVTQPSVLGARGSDARPPERLAPGDGPLPVDFWFSFRSPYSYLALERIAGVAERHPITLRLRPLAPMVDRGIPLPPVKRMYIARDTKRIADRLGIDFGVLCDPIGKGAEHCLAITCMAAKSGQALAFARSAARGIWTEARDVADYVDLRAVVERAGLRWDDARAAIADPAWREEIGTNAADLTTIGLWGVPAFSAGSFRGWGQDRLDFLEDRLRRHAAAVAASPTPVAQPAEAT
jgi:2-hydroxychromene-2-carboxylate isomerase